MSSAAVKALTLLLTWVVPEASLLSRERQSLPFYDLLIVIPCHGSRDFARRTAIRNSWAQYINSPSCNACQKRKVRLLFVAGQEGEQENLSHEAEEFNDLGILPDFGQFEYYTARAEKTQRSLRYAIEHFRFRLLVKADTDSWVFVDRLLEFLEQRSLFSIPSDDPGVYGGDFGDGTNVHAVEDPEAKWFDGVFRKFTGERIYPKHAKGAGYLLSPDLVEFIASMGPGIDGNGRGESGKSGEGSTDDDNQKHWAHMPRLEDLPSEDVSIGFWLQAVNHTKIEMPVSIQNGACAGNGGKELVVDHYVSPEEMSLRWCRYVRSSDPCDARVVEADCGTSSGSLESNQKTSFISSGLRSALARGTKSATKTGRGTLLSALRARSPLFSVLRNQAAKRGLKIQQPLGKDATNTLATKVHTDEKQAWMLMQHGKGLSSVSDVSALHEEL